MGSLAKGNTIISTRGECVCMAEVERKCVKKRKLKEKHVCRTVTGFGTKPLLHRTNQRTYILGIYMYIFSVWSFQLNYVFSKINSFPLVFLGFSSVYRRVSMRTNVRIMDSHWHDIALHGHRVFFFRIFCKKKFKKNIMRNLQMFWMRFWLVFI